MRWEKHNEISCKRVPLAEACGAIFVRAVWFILLSLEWYIKPSPPYPVFSPRPQCLILISHRRLYLISLSTIPSSFFTSRMPSTSGRRNFQIYQVSRLSRHADPEGWLYQSYHVLRQTRPKAVGSPWRRRNESLPVSPIFAHPQVSRRNFDLLPSTLTVIQSHQLPPLPRKPDLVLPEW